jgi:hypothetical protein
VRPSVPTRFAALPNITRCLQPTEPAVVYVKFNSSLFEEAGPRLRLDIDPDAPVHSLPDIDPPMLSPDPDESNIQLAILRVLTTDSIRERRQGHILNAIWNELPQGGQGQLFLPALQGLVMTRLIVMTSSTPTAMHHRRVGIFRITGHGLRRAAREHLIPR